MSETRRFARAAGVVGAVTLVSRIMGYVRDAVVAGFFGAGMAADAFFVAFRIPNLFRRLFIEGSFNMAFVPVFTEVMEKQGMDEARAMAGAAFRLFALLLVPVSMAGFVFAPLIVYAVAPGFAAIPEKFSLTVDLTRVVLPYIFFICLVATAMGVLNSAGHFFAPAAAPAVLNGVLIVSVFTLCKVSNPPVMGLAWGVVLGGAAQLGLQIPFLVKKGFCFWKGLELFRPALARVLRLMGPAILGAAVYQINIVVGTLLASLLPSGSVSYLYYADRLVQFPLGVFGIALATATLPSLSRQAGKGDVAGLRESLVYALNLIFFITIPAALGLGLLARPIVSLLFERGLFGVYAAQMTARALECFAVGLPAVAAVRIVVSVFNAMQDTATPAKVAVIAVMVNIGFSLALMGPMAHAGLALATSLASAANLCVLTLWLKRRLGFLGGRAIIKAFIRTLTCALFMGAAVWFLSWRVLLLDNAGGLSLTLGTGLAIGLGVLVYGLTSRFVAPDQYEAAKTMIRPIVRRLGKKS